MTASTAVKNGQKKANGRESEPGKVQKKGDPCEFIDPPNHLLAKVTHDPAMAKVRRVKKGQFSFDTSRLEKMDEIIEKNQTVCVDTLNKKIKEVEPVYDVIRKGGNPPREDLCESIQYIYAVAKVLDHVPVAKICTSLLRYYQELPADSVPDTNVVVMHFDALFNRETLNVKLDAPAKMVLAALETLVDHALANAK